MRIASFNLESLDLPPRSSQSIEIRAAMLRPELERAQADIFCLQEVNSQHGEGQAGRTLAALDSLLENTPYADFHRAVSSPTGRSGPADVHNLVTLSRFPIRRSKSVQHEKVPPIGYRSITADPPASAAEDQVFDRPCLVCEIDDDRGRKLHVINCHLRAPLAKPIAGQKLSPFVWKSVSGWAEGYCLAAIKRNAQALEIRLLVDDMLADDPSACVLLCGDFNAEAFESPLRILIGAEQDTGNGTLAEKSLILLDRNIPLDRRFSVIHQGRPQMLDHILCSRSMYGRFRRVCVFNEALGDEAIGFARIDRSAGSCHACVVAYFSD